MKGVAFYNVEYPVIKEDIELAKEEITRVLLTSKGERVNKPEYGSRLKSFLFDFDVVLNEDIQSEILATLNRWIPYITVKNLYASKSDERTMYIRMTLMFNDTLEEFEYEQLIKV